MLANKKKRKPKKLAPKTSPPKPLVHRNHTGEVPFKVRDIPSIRSIAPGNAALTAVLDLGRLRVSPWRKELLNVFEAYPDYHRVVGLSDIDPTQVYDKLLITTADPTSFTQTLMVANLRKKQPLQATQKQLASIVREDLVWTQREGFPTARPQDIWWVQRIEDPRVFAIPAPNVLALAQPDHLPYLAARSRATRKNPRGFFPPLPPPIGAKEGTLPAVLVVELSRMHMRMGGAAATLPQPTAMRLVVHDDARPLIRLRMAFQNPEDAQRFLEQAPALVREFSSKILVKVMGYSGLLQRIQFRQDSDPSAAYIELRGTPDETRRILRLMARSIKSHTRALQPRPEDLPQDPSTAAQNALKIPVKDGTSSTSQEGPKSGSTTGRSLMDDAPPTSANPSLKLNPSVGSSTSQPSSSGGFGARRDALFAPKNAETLPKTSSTASSTSTRVEPTKNGGGGGQPTRGEEQEAQER